MHACMHVCMYVCGDYRFQVALLLLLLPSVVSVVAGACRDVRWYFVVDASDGRE